MNHDETRSVFAVVLLVIAVLVLLPLLFMPLMMLGGGMMGGWGGWNQNWGPNAGWGWPAMLLFWVLMLGGLAAVLAWIFKRSNQGHGSSDDEALTILRQRYARGEIDKEQYEQIKRDLTAS